MAEQQQIIVILRNSILTKFILFRFIERNKYFFDREADPYDDAKASRTSTGLQIQTCLRVLLLF